MITIDTNNGQDVTGPSRVSLIAALLTKEARQTDLLRARIPHPKLILPLDLSDLRHVLGLQFAFVRVKVLLLVRDP